MKNDRWTQKVTIWVPKDGYERKRNRGRQTKKWQDEIKEHVSNLWTRITEN